MYSAVIVTVKEVRPHRNADRLQCVDIGGHNVIVGDSCRPGQRLVYFPPGGLLDENYARENNVPRRVKIYRLRGEVSNGLALPVETLGRYTDPAQLRNGDRISVLGGKMVCTLYYSPVMMDVDVRTCKLVRYYGQKHDPLPAKVPPGIEVIGRFAFSHNSRFSEVIISDTVRDIEEGAFHSCQHLKRIEIPGSVSSVGQRAFEWCLHLREAVIHEGVKAILFGAFGDCRELESVTLPDSITTIHAGAFYGCRSLKTIRIPREADFIGNLLDIPGLEKVTMAPGNKHFTLEDEVLFNRDKTVLMRYPRWKRDVRYIVPAGVTEIAENAFDGNDYLTEVVISDGVRSIGHRAFQNCHSLRRAVIPPGAEDLGIFLFIGIHTVPPRTRKRIRGDVGKATLGSIISTFNSMATEEGVLICGKPGSAAERYADREGIWFEVMD